MDIWGFVVVTFIELPNRTHNCKMNHYEKFEIEGTILNCLNKRKEIIVPEGRTGRTYFRKASLLKTH